MRQKSLFILLPFPFNLSKTIAVQRNDRFLTCRFSTSQIFFVQNDLFLSSFLAFYEVFSGKICFISRFLNGVHNEPSGTSRKDIATPLSCIDVSEKTTDKGQPLLIETKGWQRKKITLLLEIMVTSKSQVSLRKFLSLMSATRGKILRDPSKRNLANVIAEIYLLPSYNNRGKKMIKLPSARSSI